QTVAVPCGTVAQDLFLLQMRCPLAKVPHQPFLAIGLTAQLKDLLLPEKIHWQSACNEIRKLVRRCAFQILGVVVIDQRMAGFEELHEFALDAWIRRSVAIFEVIHATFEEGVLFEKFEHTKGGTANGENVHASVFVALDDIEDFGGAANTSDAVRKRKQHAEFGFVLQAGSYHLAVAGLENVQGKVRAGEQDDVQRKQRNAFWPHGSQVKSYQTAEAHVTIQVSRAGSSRPPRPRLR